MTFWRSSSVMRLRRTRSSLKLTRNSRMRRVIDVERIGVLGELRAAIDVARLGRQARLAHAVAQLAEHALEPAQLGMPLERLEALHDHLGRQMRKPVELFNRHAQRLPQLLRFRRGAWPPGRSDPSTSVDDRRRLPSSLPGRAQSGELVADVADLDGVHLAARQLLDAQIHLVDAAEDDVERVAVEERRIGLRRDEQLFELMGDLGDVGEAEHQRRAFDAVSLAQRLGDRVGSAWRLLEPQQRRAQRLEAVARLLRRTCRRRWTCRCGFMDVSRAGSSNRNTSLPRHRRRETRACGAVRAAAPASASEPTSDTARHR